MTPGKGVLGSEALAQTLAAAGVSHVFGIPGEHCLGIVDAVDRHDSLRFVSVRHESNAAFMAEAWGKLTGAPAACLGSASVGASNLLAGVNVAQHDSTPLVAIVGQVSTEHRGRGAWQEADLVGVFGPMCKLAVEVTTVASIAETAARTVALATTGRPGPVLLSCPVDVQDALGPAALPAPSRARTPVVADEDLLAVVEMLRTADRPLLVVGGGIRAAGARADLVRLADEANLPVVTGFRRADAFPNDSGSYLGGLGLAASPEVSEAVLSADLLIAVGTRLSELTTLRYSFPAPGQHTVHIDIDGETPATQWLPSVTRLTGDAGHALRGLARECRRLGVRGPDRWWRSHRSVRRTRPAPGAEPGSFTDLVRGVAASLDDVLPDDAVVTSDAGDFFLGCAPEIGFEADRRYLGPTSGTMGYGLPAAVAAKLAAPQAVCVALCGDGGFMMSLPELETAVRYGAAVVVVVFNNNAYGSIVRHQARRYDAGPVGSELGNPPFDRLAELFGADGHLVTRAEDFDEAFGKAVASGRPCVIEVRLAG